MLRNKIALFGILGLVGAFGTTILPATLSISSVMVPAAFAADAEQSPEQKKAIELIDKGAAAMKEKNFAAAVKSFREALDMDSRSESAKKKLIEAHDAYGASLGKEPKKAIIQYHRALSLNKADAAAKAGIEQSIKAMGMNPKTADTRIKLADQAQVDGDREGVGLEMEAADFLKGHPNQDVVYGDESKSKK